MVSSPRAETPARGPDAPAPEYPAPVEAARERHAATLGVAAAEVTVVAYEEKNWSDSSLGCQRPGEMYMQVITPGYRVVVSHDGEQAIYHTDQRETPSMVRCDRPVIRDLGDAPAPGAPTE